MKYCAELNESNVVLRVICVGDDVADAEAWCTDFFKGGVWKETFMDGTRKLYAGVDYTYDPAKIIFITNQPYPSWALDDNSDWQPPLPGPTETDTAIDENTWWVIYWSEEAYQADNTKGWKGYKSDDMDNPTLYDWNGSEFVLA